MSEDDFLLLYKALKPVENIGQSEAVDIIIAMMEEMTGEKPEVYSEDAVMCIGTLQSGMFLLSDGILDGVIEKDGIIKVVKSNDPVN